MVLLIESPCLLRAGSIYYPATLDLDSLTEAGSLDGDFVEIDGVRSPLYKGESIQEHIEYFARVYGDRFSKGVEREFTRFLKESEAKRENLSASSLRTQERLVSAILLGVMPRFVSFHKKSALADVLKGVAPTQDSFFSKLIEQLNAKERKIYERCTQKVNGLEAIDPAYKKQLLNEVSGLSDVDPWEFLVFGGKGKKLNRSMEDIDRQQRISRLLGKPTKPHEPLFFVDRNAVYHLENGAGGKIGFVIDGSRYQVGRKHNTNFTDLLAQGVERLLVNEKKKEFARELADKTTEDLGATNKERMALALFMKEIESFEKEDFGVIAGQERHTLYIKVPEYALVNKNKEIFLFPSARIATYLSLTKSGFSSTVPRILEKYTHPFLSGDYAGQNICIGDYKFNSKAYSLERAVENLSIGKQIILEGYKVGSKTMTPYRDLHRDNADFELIEANHPKLKNGEVKITNQ